MFLRFGVQNYLSFDSYQEISFIASTLREEDLRSVPLRRFEKHRVLPSIVMYGANASGKTNLIAALRRMKNLIHNSHSGTSDATGISRRYFRLGGGKKEEASRFDCDIVINDVRYHYGFDLDDEKIVREWLYFYPKNRRVVLFFREHKSELYLGPKFPEKSKARQAFSLARSNSLFLSAAAQNNVRLLADIHAWFDKKLVFSDDYSGMISNRMLNTYLGNQKLRGQIGKFISSIDSNILEIKAEIAPEETDQQRNLRVELENFLRKVIPQEVSLEEEMLRDMHPKEYYRLVHSFEVDGDPIPLEDESRGTIKLLHILGPIFDCIDGGKVFVCDELESGLHAIISCEIMKMFQHQPDSRSMAQGLFTTHDTNLLDLRNLRRDQVWFAEKARAGATHLYSLADLSVRRSDNIERGYLQGRFGAIPFLPDIERVREGS